MTTTSQATPAKQTDKLSIKEKIGYGMGDLGSNMVWGMTTTFLLFFYTDVFGLAAAAVGTLFVVARVFDAINDPIMGMITERYRSRWGKFRQYLLFGAPLMGLFLIITFSTPSLGKMTTKLIYAYIAYIGLGVIYTAVNLPYGALATTMTQNPADRNALSVLRSLGAIIGGGLIVGMATPSLVSLLGGDNAARGWQLTAVIYAIIGVACLWIVFATSKERFVSEEVNRLSFFDVLRMLKRNTPFILLAVTIFLLASGMFIRMAAPIYYMTYNVGRPEMLGALLGVSTIVLIFGMFVGQVVAGKIGKKKTMISGMIVSIIGMIAFHFAPYSNLGLIIAINSLISFGMAFGFGLMWSMISDTVEYSEWQTGIRAEGGIYSVASFVMKLASAVAGGVPALILAWTHYTPNVAQTDLALNGILSMMTIVPIIFSIGSLIPLFFYHLDEATFARITAEIAARKTQAGAANQ